MRAGESLGALRAVKHGPPEPPCTSVPRDVCAPPRRHNVRRVESAPRNAGHRGIRGSFLRRFRPVPESASRDGAPSAGTVRRRRSAGGAGSSAAADSNPAGRLRTSAEAERPAGGTSSAQGRQPGRQTQLPAALASRSRIRFARRCPLRRDRAATRSTGGAGSAAAADSDPAGRLRTSAQSRSHAGGSAVGRRIDIVPHAMAAPGGPLKPLPQRLI